MHKPWSKYDNNDMQSQRERLENLIDWNGFEPKGHDGRSVEVDEDNMQDADEGL